MGSDDVTWPRRGSVLGGKFEIGELLGEGGMAIVVAATDRASHRNIALKLPRPERRRERDLERFGREAAALRSLASPHLPVIYEAGTLRDGELEIPYIAFERLDGIDLASVLATRTLPASAAAEIVGQTCRALAVAHAAGIVHRDLKPANLFLTASEQRVVVKLLDFGICRSQQRTNATTTGTLLGSPAYMPPERMRPSAAVDALGDQWSLGIVLHEIVSGQRPFDAPAFPDLCLQILLDDAPALPDVPAELARIVRRCLEKEPEQRFPDVSALGTALAPLAAPIAPVELGLVERPVAARRRPWARIALAVGAVAAVALAIGHVRAPESSWVPAIAVPTMPASLHVEPAPVAPVIVEPQADGAPAIVEPRVDAARSAKAPTRSIAIRPAARPTPPPPATQVQPDPLASPF